MATMLQKGLLGYDPIALRAQEQKQWATMYGQAGSPYEKMGLALAQLGGAVFSGTTDAGNKANAVNKALENASANYQQGTAEYYKAIMDDPALSQYADTQEFATQKYLEAKQTEQKTYLETVKAVKDNPELADTFTEPLKISLLQKATKNGWSEEETPVPQTKEEISAFAKQYGVDKDPMYRKYIAIQSVADKESRKEVQEEDKRLLTMTSIKSTIARNNKELAKIDSDKFDTGNRWNQEREAALALFAANKLDPNVPLKGINLANTEIVNAQKVALRQPWQGKANAAITPAGSTAPSVNTITDLQKKVESAGQVFDPNKWDYRVVNGQVQRKAK